MTIRNLHIPRRSGIKDKGVTVLAGDIGGTKTNLAFYEATETGLNMLHIGKYPSAEYASSEAIMQQFLSDNKCPAPDRICLGVAGPVLDGKVNLTNLSWDIDITEVKSAMGVDAVFLLNDLESMAYGLAGLTEQDLITLHTGDEKSTGNMAIIAPGTGLGEAGIYWNGTNHFPFPTEGGHADFSPRTDLDYALLKFLQNEYGVVSWEKVVAGPAIVDIYRFLRDVKKMEEPAWLKDALEAASQDSAVISGAAIEQKAAICVETMLLFVRYLAREASNLVLKMKATGGLFLGGGIPPKIAPLLLQKEFMEHYMDCDRMQHLLENVPIRIIKNDKTGLIGAGYYGAYLM
ncbi:glucokinase [Niastella caeni]|uniref:Glucokinase n=1 Tax=Niastella caeni TaxID=2569763 RepID=A0A4V4H0V1_9BACT|nr:glucokinase [Niastella caeni]THU38016.1 glucokinase [Niastella caeni]